MEKVESLRGVPGMLRPFKEFIKSLELNGKDQIVFYGCPGTCTPFVELLGYAVRDLGCKIIFVPFLDENKAVVLENKENVGLQALGKPEKIDPSLVVVMGGLAMPNVPVSADDVKKTTSRYTSRIAGICFMSMFEKEKWTDTLNFDLIIDAKIDPVDIWKN
ncbi:DUF2124 family protein [Methanolacinia petrolearia]|uniref:DUF2124 family protein n=1 Tax=Methanolacinia petrolearia TaxID=54120 RepID=UPI003BA9ED22